MKQGIDRSSVWLRRRLTTACACIGMLAAATLAWAQVERPAANPMGAAPTAAPNAAGGMGGGRNQQTALPEAAIAADAHNFSGIWKVDNTASAAANNAGMSAGAVLAAGMAAASNAAGMAAAAGMNAGAITGGMAAGAQINANGKSSGLLCIPDKNIFGGGDGGLEIIQTANQITLVAEENHRVRRIYLNTEHPKTVKPSYMGHSVGHWEGDALVVDTTGLRSSSSGTIDRIRKINNGSALEVSTVNKGDSGSGRITILAWNGRQIAEWICEDYTDEFFSEDYK